MPPFIHTASGRAVPLLNPQPDDISLPDIAESLSKICRFTGHTQAFYSVAQHSVLVHDLLPPPARAYGLLHDAHEAYIGDLSTPLKWALEQLGDGAGFATLRERFDSAIHAAAGLEWPAPPAIAALVKAADLCALATEKRDLLKTDSFGGPDWGYPLPAPSRHRIIPLSWSKAQEVFWTRLQSLLIHPSGAKRPQI
jgi:uncharacterized protein